MREIKFRGKRIDNGEWVYGMPYGFKQFVDFKRGGPPCILIFNPEWDLEAQFNYLKDPVAFAHLKDSIWKVIPESVGQFIEKHDKKGKEIYEKDILKLITAMPELQGKLYQVKWDQEGAGFGTYALDGATNFRFPIGAGHFYERVGNIYENPELIEKYRKIKKGGKVDEDKFRIFTRKACLQEGN